MFVLYLWVQVTQGLDVKSVSRDQKLPTSQTDSTADVQPLPIDTHFTRISDIKSVPRDNFVPQSSDSRQGVVGVSGRVFELANENNGNIYLLYLECQQNFPFHTRRIHGC